MKNLDRAFKKQLAVCPGIAAAIRCVTTYHPEATVAQVVEAGVRAGLNANTIRKQYHIARKEDAEVWQLCQGMTIDQFVTAVIGASR